MSDLQLANNCELLDLFSITGDFGELAVEKLTYDLRLSPCLILTGRRWWLLLLASWREAYWVRNASATSENCIESAVAGNRTILRLLLLGQREK